MYCSITDYSRIYSDVCGRRRGDHTSFNRYVLPPLVAEFCRSVEAKSLLELSGGHEGLGRELESFGIRPTTTGYGAGPGSRDPKFDLAEYDATLIAPILRKVSEGGNAFATTCFDVLEHIDREHVAAAVYNLYSLTQRFLVISISTRPSAFDNLLNPALLPIEAWLSAFNACGFRLFPNGIFKTATTVPALPATDDMLLINRWQTADIFNDAHHGEPKILVLEKISDDISYNSILKKIDDIVDVRYRKDKRKHFKLSQDKFINFNLHYQQEWSLFRPLLDVIPRSQARFLIRPGMMQVDMFRAICGYLKRNGVATIIFDDAADLPWSEIKGQVLITGAESTAAPHLMPQEVVALARLHGCQTHLFQHGIWPRSFENAVLTFLSQNIILYGAEEIQRLNGRIHTILAADVPWGFLPDRQVSNIGSAKFTDHLMGNLQDLGIKFGYDSSKFKKSVLIGTKNLRGRWGVNNINDDFIGQINQAIEKNNDIMFVIRPHPLDRAETFATIKAPNVRLFDEVVGLLADLPLSRVLPCVDLVATSPSSLIVDASISTRPTFVYDTGQPVEFDGVTPQPFSALEKSLAGTSELARLEMFARQFKEKYAEKVDENFYINFSNLIEESKPPTLDEVTAVSVTLLGQIVKTMRVSKSVEDRAVSLEMRVAADSLTIAELRDKNEQLLSQSGDLKLRLREVSANHRETVDSPYWRPTAPIRSLFSALQAIRKRIS